MAKKMSKHMTAKPFPVEVCDAIRHHIGERKALESKRVNAFEDRDAALEEKHEIDDHDSDEYLEACKRHSDAIASIDGLSSSIKWHRNQIDDLVEKADEPQLEFMYDPPAEETHAKGGPKQLRLAPHEGSDAETRPVGRPGKPRPEAPDPSKGDGVDEHLNASVNELDIRENLKSRLVGAGLTTVGRVASAIEDKAKDLRDILNCGENIASEIKKAVKQYRTTHRKAALAAEGGAR